MKESQPLTITFPVGIGDKVYYIVAVRGTFTTLLHEGTVIEREVTEVAYDGKISIHSSRPLYDTYYGNLWEYLGEKVFVTKEEAEAKLAEIREKAGI